MASPQAEPLVKAFAALLHAPATPLEPCLKLLQQAHSLCDYRGLPHPFQATDHYAEEMGPRLVRTLVSFRDLHPASFLPRAKLHANDVEARLAPGGPRRVNVDIGYVDLHKVVLASCKGRGSKVYLADGVWADMTLAYAHGRFEPFPWSFPDFRQGAYDEDLRHIRELLKAHLRGRAP